MIHPTPRKRHWRSGRAGEDRKHRENIRRLPCCVCGAPPPNTVHHLKQTGQRGIGLRSPDRYGLPLCMFAFSRDGSNCHDQVEAVGSKHEIDWFVARGIDPLALADRLWANRHSLDRMRQIVIEHRGQA